MPIILPHGVIEISPMEVTAKDLRSTLQRCIDRAEKQLTDIVTLTLAATSQGLHVNTRDAQERMLGQLAQLYLQYALTVVPTTEAKIYAHRAIEIDHQVMLQQTYALPQLTTFFVSPNGDAIRGPTRYRGMFAHRPESMLLFEAFLDSMKLEALFSGGKALSRYEKELAYQRMRSRRG